MGHRIIKDGHPHDSVPHDFVHNKASCVPGWALLLRLVSDQLWNRSRKRTNANGTESRGHRIIKDEHPHDSVPMILSTTNRRR